MRTSTIVAQGNAAVEILSFAEKNRTDLILISTHGRSGTGDWTLGSIANKVLQRAHVPILLVRSHELEARTANKAPWRILVLLDGSDCAERVIPHVEGLAKETDNEVFLLRITEPLTTPHFVVHSGGFDWEKYEKDVLARLETEAKHYLGKREHSLQRKGVKATSVSLVGRPARTILQYAEDDAIDLIALSSHGLSGVTKWVFGSVDSKIIQHSSQSILLVRPPLSVSEAHS